MTERGHEEESLHYLMISVLVDSLEKEGFAVRADHVGGLRAKPTPLHGFTPDIEARRGDQVRLIEVKTRSTIGLTETQEQLALLAGGPGNAYLAVPFDCIEAARKVRDDMDVDVVILPCYPFVGYVGMPR
jgi:hypothetical protein